jgi:DNA adenine methylase
VAGDLHAGLVASCRVLRDRPDELLDRLAPLEYDAQTFDRSLRPDEAGADDLASAVRFLVCNRLSRGGLGRDFAWSDRLRGGRPWDLNAWGTSKAELPRIARRLAGVDPRCGDAFELIRETAGPGTLFDLDPPYLHATRTARDVYDHEKGEGEHRRLLEAAVRGRGMVAISGNVNSLYDEALRGWDRFEIDIPNHAGQARSKQRRVEGLWLRDRGA